MAGTITAGIAATGTVRALGKPLLSTLRDSRIGNQRKDKSALQHNV
jgi:hypothetical protein